MAVKVQKPMEVPPWEIPSKSLEGTLMLSISIWINWASVLVCRSCPTWVVVTKSVTSSGMLIPTMMIDGIATVEMVIVVSTIDAMIVMIVTDAVIVMTVTNVVIVMIETDVANLVAQEVAVMTVMVMVTMMRENRPALMTLSCAVAGGEA